MLVVKLSSLTWHFFAFRLPSGLMQFMAPFLSCYSKTLRTMQHLGVNSFVSASAGWFSIRRTVTRTFNYTPGKRQ